MVIIASAFIVFGLSIVYGITGTLNYVALREALSAITIGSSDMNLLIIAFIFIAAGYAIRGQRPRGGAWVLPEDLP